ncbi:MAG: fatty acid--CoA ligase [Gammaproteobacteria bacterium]|nr:fatty acid--CoA ligase [Gammaproteobacteria bacterium]
MSVIGQTPATAAYDYPLLVRHLLHTPLAYYPDREIVYADGTRLTYRRFRERIGRLADALSSLGVRPGDTVAVLDWDSHRYLECFFAVPMLGAVLHTVNVRLSPEQIIYTINHAGDDVLLVHQDFMPLVEQIQPHIDRPCRIVLLSDGGDATGTALDLAGEYEALLSDGDPSFEFEDFDENTRATTFYTTGTTGDPKGVYYSHRQLVLHTLGIAASHCLAGQQGMFHSEDVYMPITPMFHVHAWGIPYLATMAGVKQVYPGRYAPERLLSLIQDEKVTFSHCVPTILHMLLQAREQTGTDLSGWKVIIGGSALPEGLAARALDLGIDLYGGYGLSETCPVLTIARLDNEDSRRPAAEQLTTRCRAGRPVVMVDLRTVDERGHDVPRDGQSTGEVVARAPWLTEGYLKEPERSESLWRDGYLHTGDIGFFDDKGYLKVTDRLKDVIKTGGEWISSVQLEDIVSQMPNVNEVAAIGVADEKWGERPLIIVVPAEDADLDEASVLEHLQQAVKDGRLSDWAVPDKVRIVDQIDKTSVGKIDKKSLRRRYGG